MHERICNSQSIANSSSEHFFSTNENRTDQKAPIQPQIIMKKQILLFSLLTSLHLSAGFEVKDHQGRIEIHDDGKLVFGWQSSPLKQPVGGEEFAGSAFIHPLRTPSGFDLTVIQPADHKHHFGVWWPWKLLTVEGEKYNTWELQNGQGRHVAGSASIVTQSKDEVVLKLMNHSEIKVAGAKYESVLKELTTLRFSRFNKDAYVIDLHIQQSPVKGKKVEVTQYRYSGFSWRGSASWNKDNSQMRTSGGHHRDNANSQPAHWAMVDGDKEKAAAKGGRATMLVMSAASKNNGTPERLRVWNSSMHGGSPFINFNPVMKVSQPMLDQQKEVADRRYRLIVADRAIAPDEAEKLWQAWK